MHSFTETEYQKKVEPILRKVFLKNDPYSSTFSKTITERLIIFPCENYLETNLVEGLIAAASELGENNCFLSDLWIDPDRVNHYHLSLSELCDEQIGSSYNIDWGLWIMYIIYSEKGTWGLMKSDECHGLLGGSARFINKVRKFVPNLDNQVYFFLKKLQSLKRYNPGARLEWVPELFIHVYGKETAEKLLKEAELL